MTVTAADTDAVVVSNSQRQQDPYKKLRKAACLLAWLLVLCGLSVGSVFFGFWLHSKYE